jgi:integrase
MARTVKGSVFLDGARPCWYVKFYDPRQKKTVKEVTHVPRDAPGGKEEAEKFLRLCVEEFSQTITVGSWAREWLKTREQNGDFRNTVSRLRDHVLPVIGKLAIDEVTPKEVNMIVQALRTSKKAAGTVRNVYSNLSAMFRDAIIEGHLEARDNPCVLGSVQLGPIEDSKSGWRAGAVMSRLELRMLITDTRIPIDRRVQYGLLGLAALRDGEMVALQWGDIRPAKPLNLILVRRSHESQRTKTVRERSMPVHPTLQLLLEEWAKRWPVEFGKPITDDALVMPTIFTAHKGPRLPPGVMRTNGYVYHRWLRDLKCFGLRHRRVHDLRRTFISLARSDGAIEAILKWGTHSPPRTVMSMYTSIEWTALCGEVAKLNMTLLPVEKMEQEKTICDPAQGRSVFNLQELQ